MRLNDSAKKDASSQAFSPSYNLERASFGLFWSVMKSDGESLSSSGSSRDDRFGRITSRAKTEAVLRLLKGDSVEAVSRELGVTISRVERWRSRFLEAGAAELAKRTDNASKSWVAEHSRSIWQWIWLLLALVAIISILAVLMQGSPQE
jgi:hypothetical protein